MFQVLKDTISKYWVSIIDQMLHVYQNSSDTRPLYVFSLLNALVRCGAEVPPPLSSSSSSSVASHLLPKCSSLPFCTREECTVVIEMGGAGVHLSEDDDERVTLTLSTKEEKVICLFVCLFVCLCCMSLFISRNCGFIISYQLHQETQDLN